jgi:hypothetical protein
MSNCGEWRPVELSRNSKVLPKVNAISLFDRTTEPLGSRPLASPLTISGLLTLLSKCFSTFPQGTCLLSISRQYLAMDGGYHPFCALLPKSVTQSNVTVRTLWMPKTGLSPSVACLSRHLRHPSILATSMMHNSKQQNHLDSHLGLFPFRSPLLGESLLVSIPPLNYMLKFSG